MKNILIIKGDPRKEGTMKDMADIYAKEMIDSGFDVKIVDLSELSFDPILWEGYGSTRSAEMKEISDYLQKTNLIAFFYPIWLMNVPAILKGFLENLFWIRESFNFKNKEYFLRGKLKGKKATLFYSLGGKEIEHRLFGQPGYLALRHPLWISGIFSIQRAVFENLNNHRRKSDDYYLKRLKKQIQKDKKRLGK